MCNFKVMTDLPLHMHLDVSTKARHGNRAPWIFIAGLLLASACQQEKEPLFRKVPSEESSIAFSNTLVETVDFNILNYLYFYNGGGVAVGDINRDGWPDLYFTANMQPNKLYLNKGNFQFEDITERAGVGGQPGWTTGTAMADVNGDGWLDIYVCQLDGYEGQNGHNQLYLNRGDLRFEEVSEEYGLNFRGFSSQAAFLDYDLDGDLDLYLLNHSVHANQTYQDTSLRRNIHPTAGDRLFRNDLEEKGSFTDVTQTSGIYTSQLGYGLGITVSDINQDGWPDIYVGNDFHENDYLYINQQDGTFREQLQEMLGHTSRFSMGVDIADLNNDARPDIFTLDMKPRDEKILKTSGGPDPYGIYEFKLSYGYSYQFPRNALQLNRGAGQFSEIAQYSGVDATDWSWGAYFGDFDLDGLQDLMVTNGIYRRPNDLDYITYITQPEAARSLKRGITPENFTFIERMPQVNIPNVAFSQREDLKFEEVTQAWGLAQPVYANGAAYADLDADGDLDWITNNINEPASLYENRAADDTAFAYLRIALKGPERNPYGVGAKVLIRAGKQTWYREQQPVRGWLSSVDPVIHFGLGKLKQVDTVKVLWPGGGISLLHEVATRQTLVIEAGESTAPENTSPKGLLSGTDMHMKDLTPEMGLPYRHRENYFVDFNIQPLMPHMLSTLGPALATGDVNGDGLEDIFAGGAHLQASQLLLQSEAGTFLPQADPVWKNTVDIEAVDATFFDAEGDGDLDLYVVSGGNQYFGEVSQLLDHLYLNDGQGHFTRAEEHLPLLYQNGACVADADIDGDGDTDLFVGGRSRSGLYGMDPESYILENQGDGHFVDATPQWIGGTDPYHLGMVSDAEWVDIEGDGKLDLVVVGEWMPLSIWKQEAGRLQSITVAAGLAETHGWWNTLLATDWDQDGDMDLFAGNLGLNSEIKASREAPCTLTYKDFDGNGSLDPILCYYKNGVSYPKAGRDELVAQLAPLKKKYPSYAAYAGARLEDIFPREALKQAGKKVAYEFASAYFENRGDGLFSFHPLPTPLQFAPIFAFMAFDVNDDGQQELLVGGNFFGVGPDRGRYDAFPGAILARDSENGFQVPEPGDTHFWIRGEARKMGQLKHPEYGALILVGRNNDSIQVFGPGKH